MDKLFEFRVPYVIPSERHVDGRGLVITTLMEEPTGWVASKRSYRTLSVHQARVTDSLTMATGAEVAESLS